MQFSHSMSSSNLLGTTYMYKQQRWRHSTRMMLLLCIYNQPYTYWLYTLCSTWHLWCKKDIIWCNKRIFFSISKSGFSDLYTSNASSTGITGCLFCNFLLHSDINVTVTAVIILAVGWLLEVSSDYCERQFRVANVRSFLNVPASYSLNLMVSVAFLYLCFFGCIQPVQYHSLWAI